MSHLKQLSVLPLLNIHIFAYTVLSSDWKLSEPEWQLHEASTVFHYCISST